MKTTEFIVENSVIAQEADDMHRDHEVQMARSQMYSAAQAAIEIHRLLRDISEMEGLEGWVQSKLTLASQYLESVRDYMKYEAASQEPEMTVFAEDAADYALESLISEEGETGEERDASARRENERYDSARNYQGRNARGDVIRSGGEVVKGNPNPPSLLQRAAGTLGLPNTATDALGEPMYKSSRPKAGGGGGGGSAGVMQDPEGARSRFIHFENKKMKEATTGPSIGGVSQTANDDGTTTTNYDMGPLSTSTTNRPSGKVSTATYDMGPMGSATTATGPMFGGAQGKGNQISSVTNSQGKTTSIVGKPDAQDINKALNEKNKKLKETASAGASGSSGVAVSMGGSVRKPTSGVPKKLGNAHKPKKVNVGKGIY
jgi:hypothetical protein